MMEGRRASVSSVLSGSTDVSLYNNNNDNESSDKNAAGGLKLERSDHDGVSGTRNYFLRWKGFEGNLIRMVEGLKFGPSLSDVTLSCEDGYKAHLHKLILASASLYFYQIFEDVSESKHPTIILSGIGSDVLEMLVSYMYCGFIDVPNDKLAQLISAGKSLRIKGLMDMKDDVQENSMDLPSASPRPPPAHLSNGGGCSTSSFMMSPLSEPRLTPTFTPTSYAAAAAAALHHGQPAHKSSLFSLAGSWPAGGDSLQLLATAAHMRSSSEEERSSSPEASPLPTPEATGHSAISAVSAVSAIAASRAQSRRRREMQQLPFFRYDRENDENDPTHGPSSSSGSNSDNSNHSVSDLRAHHHHHHLLQENRAINLSLRPSEPLTPLNTNFASSPPSSSAAAAATASGLPPLLNIPNPNVFWPKREDTPTAFRPLVPASTTTSASPIAAHVASSGESSQNSSPLDFSNWRLGTADFSVQRLFGNGVADSGNSRFPSTLSQMVARDDNRTALMAVAAAISAAASANAANNERSLSVPPPAQSPGRSARRGPRLPRGPRAGTPHMSFRKGTSSPTNTGANWKSRQPTECNHCKRMFSNKFNLKQHILNMHSTGGEVRCEQCGKMVKNKWYLRRHKVTHHGAPLRKYKKESEFRHMDSDNEDMVEQP